MKYKYIICIPINVYVSYINTYIITVNIIFPPQYSAYTRFDPIVPSITEY